MVLIPRYQYLSFFFTEVYASKFVRLHQLSCIFFCYDNIQRCQVLSYALAEPIGYRNALPTGGAFLFLGRRMCVAVSYKKLWKLLIDRDMKRKDLCELAGISSASVTKMGRNGHVTTEILVKICTALDCQIEDIMEVVPPQE